MSPASGRQIIQTEVLGCILGVKYSPEKNFFIASEIACYLFFNADITPFLDKAVSGNLKYMIIALIQTFMREHFQSVSSIGASQ